MISSSSPRRASKGSEGSFRGSGQTSARPGVRNRPRLGNLAPEPGPRRPLVSAPSSVVRGEEYLSPRAAKGLSGDTAEPLGLLSAPESRVYSLLGDGFGVNEIAEDLSLSARSTVRLSGRGVGCRAHRSTLPALSLEETMRGFVGNTDHDWYSFLRDRSPLEEVNFWQPSGRTAFRALAPGEPFFFRLKMPHNAVAGFGYFARHEIVPAWLAWDSFGPLNGAPDLATLLRRVEKYRRITERDPQGQYRIGCLMISQPVFFAEDAWVRQPAGFSKNIVKGAGYDLSSGEGKRLFEECRARVGVLAPLREEEARFGAPQLVLPRLGQGTFRVAVTAAYGGACAVTGEHSLPVLDVAHIQPYGSGGAHSVANGLLLRSDVHRLFDRGYVTVTPDYRFEVSHRLKDDYENGKTYYALHGSRIAVPRDECERPSPSLLGWHNQSVFAG